MSESDDIFAPDPIPEEKVIEARILAMCIYEDIRLHMRNREGSAPFDPKHRYGFFDMRIEWSQFPDRDVWTNAVMDALAKMREGRL